MKCFKIVLLSAVVVGLAGCGSDSSDSEPAINKELAQKIAVTAIDGYLVGAEVYVDRNGNNVAEDNELIGSTNDAGRVFVPAADAGYPRIVRAVAGITADTDKGGRVPYTYELISGAGSDVITPYTTLAVLQDKTLEQIAQDYNFSADIIAGDYVAAKKDNNDEAKQAHLLARSVVSELGRNIQATLSDTSFIDNTVKLEAEVKSIATDKLDSSIVLIGDTGDAEKATMPPTLATFLSKNHYYSFSLNDFWRHHEGDGISNWRFDYPHTATVSNSNSSDKAQTLDLHVEDNFFYLSRDIVTGDKIETDIEADVNRDGCEDKYEYGQNQCRSEMQDDFIYLSDEFAIALSVDKDFNFYTSVDPVDDNLAGMLAQAISTAEFSAKTFYHLYDTSRRLDAFEWKPKPKMDIQAAITVSDGAAGTILIGSKTYTVLQANRDMFIIKDGDNQPSILFKGEDLATHLKKKWEETTLTKPTDD